MFCLVLVNSTLVSIKWRWYLASFFCWFVFHLVWVSLQYYWTKGLWVFLRIVTEIDGCIIEIVIA